MLSGSSDVCSNVVPLERLPKPKGVRPCNLIEGR
ncbi:MAG: DUF3982 domain-containing protein [Desulfobacteraceae bacterium]|nr:DUF3982 domain-containing protein [Desulfobacteraceae bacterium]